jgi:hypothetical protein
VAEGRGGVVKKFLGRLHELMWLRLFRDRATKS